MTDISEYAMLAEMSVSIWGGSRKDSAITAEITASKHAEDRSMRVVKQLIKGEELDAISAIAKSARDNVHNHMTLPWSDRGPRILPVELFFEYSKRMNDQKNKFDGAVEKFIGVYPSLIDAAEERLGDAFDRKDYPTPGELRNAFSMRTRVFSMPKASADFRVGLSDAVRADIEQQMRDNMAESVNAATRSLYGKVGEMVEHMAMRLENYGDKEPGAKRSKSFKDSLIRNMEELIEVLPALNVAGDEKLAVIAEKMKERLVKYDAQTLRDHEYPRKEVAAEARGILKELKDPMDFFGVAAE